MNSQVNEDLDIDEIAKNLVGRGTALGQYGWNNLRKFAEADDIQMDKLYMFSMGVVLFWYLKLTKVTDDKQLDLIMWRFIQFAANGYNPNPPHFEDAEERAKFESLLYEKFSDEILKNLDYANVFFSGEASERQDRIYSTSMIIFNEICQTPLSQFAENKNKKPGIFDRFLKKKTVEVPNNLFLGVQTIGDCLLKGESVVRELMS